MNLRVVIAGSGRHGVIMQGMLTATRKNARNAVLFVVLFGLLVGVPFDSHAQPLDPQSLAPYEDVKLKGK